MQIINKPEEGMDAGQNKFTLILVSGKKMQFFFVQKLYTSKIIKKLIDFMKDSLSNPLSSVFSIPMIGFAYVATT